MCGSFSRGTTAEDEAGVNGKDEIKALRLARMKKG
jgi:hypothetical protein